MLPVRAWPALTALVIAGGLPVPASVVSTEATAGGAVTAARPATLTRLDTVRESQWFLDTVHAPQAQSVARGAGVTVAVIDTGVDASHPDLAGAVLTGASFGNANSAAGRTDPDGHGTRMAGLIAARGGGPNNALGIAPAAKILPVAVPTQGGVISSLVEPIRWAVDHGAQVISLSLARPGGTPLPPGEADAIETAISRGVVVVVSVGNRSEMSSGSAFADLPGVVAVAGTSRSGSLYPGSLPGRHLAVAAPAEQIATIGPRALFSTGYSVGSGTSEATAIVSGVVALIRSKFPQLDVANVVNRLVASAHDLGPSGRDDTSGFGLVDAERAVTMSVAAVTANPLGEPAPASEAVASGEPQLTGVGVSKSRVVALLVCAGAVVLVVALLIGLVIWLATRRRRPPGPPPPPHPGVGTPPPWGPPATPAQRP